MANTLIGALKTLFCLNRWNVEPRIETWTEAENIAMCSHVVYAVGKHIGLDDDVLNHVIKRTLLKSINKHWLSDISAPIRERIQKISPTAWAHIIQDAAKVTAALFPSAIAPTLYGYLTLSGDYKVNDETRVTIENLVRYAQYQVALSECEANSRAFPENYKDKIDDLEAKIAEIPHERLSTSLVYSKSYLLLVRNLKHVRRWNRMNRFIESSVLAHTFIVAFLALLFSEARREQLQASQGQDPQYECILLALFHDVPEMLTGDIITPVKTIMERYDPELLHKIESQLIEEMLRYLSKPIRDDIERKGLLNEPGKNHPFSVSSLVKDCDILAGLLECAFEMSVGNNNPEMAAAFTYPRIMMTKEIVKCEQPQLYLYIADRLLPNKHIERTPGRKERWVPLILEVRHT